jgi:hypothetical protein
MGRDCRIRRAEQSGKRRLPTRNGTANSTCLKLPRQQMTQRQSTRSTLPKRSHRLRRVALAAFEGPAGAGLRGESRASTSSSSSLSDSSTDDAKAVDAIDFAEEVSPQATQPQRQEDAPERPDTATCDSGLSRSSSSFRPGADSASGSGECALTTSRSTRSTLPKRSHRKRHSRSDKKMLRSALTCLLPTTLHTPTRTVERRLERRTAGEEDSADSSCATASTRLRRVALAATRRCSGAP